MGARMDEQDGTTFNALVFRRAWSNTVRVFRNRRVDIALPALSFVVGSALFLQHYGWEAVKEQAITFAAYVLAPFGLTGLAIVLWNLALAPSELIYEVRAGQSVATKPKPKLVNWAIWKQRSEYRADEFASILAKSDPIAIAQPTERVSFLHLILEEMRSKKLPYVVERRQGLYNNRSYEVEPEDSTHIKRDDAIAWAEKKQFPVDHIK
jgi:hypothetical protein